MSDEENMEKLVADFGYYGITLPPKQILEKCLEISDRQDVTVEEFGELWISFSMFNAANNGTTLTLDSLEQFERKLAADRRAKKAGKSVVVEKDATDDILSVYSDSSEKKNATPKRQRSSDDEPSTPKRHKENKSNANDEKNLTDHLKASQPQETSMIFESFSNRKDALTVVDSYGLQTYKVKSTFKTIDADDKIVLTQSSGLKPNLKNSMLLYDAKSWKYNAMNLEVEKIGKYIVEKHNLKMPVSIVELPLLPEEGVVYGRIRNVAGTKMKQQDVHLEMTMQLSSAETTGLELRKVNQFSFFPGQIVALTASKIKPNSIIVNNIYGDATLKLYDQIPELNTSGPLQMVVASGPFTLDTDFTYEPLIDLITYVTIHKPHILVLIGPFLDANHENISSFLHPTKGPNLGSFKNHFEGLIRGIAKTLSEKGCNTQLVVVSSCKEAHHYNVFPTPAYSLKTGYSNLHFLPDPCVFDVNGLKIGVTSADILFHLSKEELYVTKVSQNPNRITRIAQHIINQQSFYPLYPPSKDICLDYKLLKLYGQLHTTPHVLVLPSNLRYFVKDIEGCVVVNPERLSKSYAGGTFARMEVYPNQTSQSAADNIVCEILKI